MKKIILTLTISVALFSCKKTENTTLETYNHSDKPETIFCDDVDKKLLSEAYYAFENAVLINATNTNRNPKRIINIDFALRNFMARAQNNIRIQDFLTEEVVTIFKVLKQQNIWDGNQLDNNGNLLNCIANSISNPQLKQTFKTLKEVNSLDPKLMATAIYGNSKVRTSLKDKVLMTYIALDLFYAKMFAVDLSKVKYITKQNPPVLAPVNKKAPALKKLEIGKPIKLNTKKKE